jgi:hypothetical protein
MRIPNKRKDPMYYIRVKSGKAWRALPTLEAAERYVNYLKEINANGLDLLKDIVVVDASGKRVIKEL